MRTLVIILGMALLALHISAQEEWIDQARAHVRTHADTGGLADLIQAQELMDYERILPHTQELNEIIKNGWTGDHLEIEVLIASERAGLEAATRAANASHIDFPPTPTVSSPVMNFLSLQTMIKLMAADSLSLLAKGEVERAAERAVDTIEISNHLCHENGPLIQHLIGYAGLTIGAKTLDRILSSPDLDEATLIKTWHDLSRVNESHVGTDAAMRREGECVLGQMRAVKDNPQMVREMLGDEMRPSDMIQAAAIMRSLEDFETFEADHNRIWETLCENAGRPYWEREELDEQWVIQQSQNPLHRLAVPNFAEAATRGDVSMTWVRLCMLQCALRLEDNAKAQSVTDPFTGWALQSNDTLIWSLGPDRETQSGRLVYDPTNGTRSPGDIVARR